MSPNDICIIDELQEMLEAGVDSFKIDGILKSSRVYSCCNQSYIVRQLIYFSRIQMLYDDKKDELFAAH